MRIEVPMSLIIVTVRVWTVTVTSSHKQLRSSVVTSDTETNTIEEESGEPENSNERSDV